MESLNGTVESIVFVHPENGFTVARIKREGQAIVIVGPLTGIQPGEGVELQGVWRSHPTYGRQFEVEKYTVSVPSEIMGIVKYLESGLIKGIGQKYAQRIVDRFGLDTLKVIDEEPERLREIEGLGPKKRAKIVECWAKQRSIRDLMVFLRTHGMTPSFAQRIFKQYGDESIEKIKESPYRLAKDIFGIGFKTADSLALRLGVPTESMDRVMAGIEFVLFEMAGEGHTCSPVEEMIGRAAVALELDASFIQRGIDSMGERIVQQGGRCWLKAFAAYEAGIAKEMKRLLSSPQKIRLIDAKKAADWAEERLNIRLAENQKAALIASLTDKVHVITGGPGTGKSTITKAILEVSTKLTSKILLAAPTGRAAKRLYQITKSFAQTIHSLLEVDFASKGFKRGRENPLDCDLIIIDESSMIDTPLLFALLRAIPSHARLLFVGDVDQLPSVGPGTVLSDIIDSGVVGITRLSEIFRQAKGSRIIVNAHKINQGQFPELHEAEGSDFHFYEATTPEAIQEIIFRLIEKEIPARYGFDPFQDIQLLSPMKKGVVGIEAMNEALQARLNPSNRPLFRAGRRYHEKDKVMQIKNNYDKKVFNGDVGRIASIDRSEEVVKVIFDEKEVEYDFTELEELSLAYATSVHKYQGSECPCIVMPIHVSHFKLLQRNLLYTAVTRGKKQVFLIGMPRAVAIAIQNQSVEKRHTGLKEALQNAKGTEPLSLQLPLF